MTHNPIIVALDVESAEEARALVERIGPSAGFYKVGMERYAAAGMDFVRDLLARGPRLRVCSAGPRGFGGDLRPFVTVVEKPAGSRQPRVTLRYTNGGALT